MANIRFLGFPNYTALPYVVPITTGTAGLVPSGLEVEWLKTEEPSEVARLATVDPYHTQVGFTTSLVPLTIDGLAVVNHNITAGGQVRFVGWGGGVVGGLLLPQADPPLSIVASTNRTGALADIDDPIYSPDGLSMSPTVTTSPWSVTLKWPSLLGTIDAAAGKMCLVVRVRRVYTGAGAVSPSSLPVCTAALAAPAYSLGYRAVTVSEAGGQVFIFPFSRANFASVADFQATLSFTPGLSGSGGQYAVLEAAAMYYEKIDLNTPTFDSGWIDVPGDERAAPVQPTRSLHYFPSVPWTNIISYTLMIRSDQAEHDPRLTIFGAVPAASAGDPDGFIQAGVVPAGESIDLSHGIRQGSGPMAGSDAEAFSGSTATGQSYGADAYRFRATDPIPLIVTREEALLLQDQIAFRRGKHGAFYVAMDSAVALQYQVFSGFWANLVRMSKPRQHGRYRADGKMLFSMDVQFTEKL